ncbi:MAG: type II CRISPR RNA-guided endonuclease Cas9, partial [Candidatus Bathyarchaeia archaeon]
MASLTLGLDVGCTSIGWALIDEEAERIVAVGVRVFPEGVDRDQQGGEKSKSQSRRDARSMRRQLARRARRRRQLRDALRKAGLLPADPNETQRVVEWNPYTLRRRALTEKLEPYEIGRALFHLAQRRGYLSNRKTDKPKDSDQKGMLAEIEGLAQALEKRGKTLGAYLADLSDDPEYRKSFECGRIRNRHTRRDMYEREFEAICEAQRPHYPNLLTHELKYGKRGTRDPFPKEPEPLPKGSDPVIEYGLYGLIFFQRKMYWPKSVVGRCELERREKRCPRAAQIAQRFRIVQEVNNLRVLDYVKREERRLTDEERATLIDYLSNAEKRSFDDIRKELRKKFGLPETVQFNLQRGGRKNLQGDQTDYALAGKKGVGKRWSTLSDETKDAIVEILIHEEREEVVLRRLTEECGLRMDEAERASRVHLADGYMSFSRVAIKKLLPYLERGLMLMADDATNSAIHAAGYLRPDERAVNQR